MPKLHLMKDDRIDQSFPLGNGEAVLGRDEQCDIRLTNNGISRQHLRLLTVMGDTFIEDLGSRNGTYVNGRLASKCALNDGDVLQVGTVELCFETDPANEVHSAPADPDATAVITPGQFGPQSRAAREAGAGIQGISPVAQLSAQNPVESPLRATELPGRQGLWARIRAWLGR